MKEDEPNQEAAPLRVLCVTTSFPVSMDDPTGFFVAQLANALARQRIRIEVLTPGNDRPAGPTDFPYPVHRFRYAPRAWRTLAQHPGGIPAALAADPRKWALVPPFLMTMAAGVVTRARTADVIWANWAVCGALAALLSPLHQKPIVTVLRGSDVQVGRRGNRVTERLLRLCAARSKALVTVAEDQAEWLRKTLTTQTPVIHLPNGVHEAFFQVPPPPSASDGLRLLFVGFLVPRKGVDILIEAMAKIRTKTPVHLDIAGRGAEDEKLKAQANRLNVADRVSFLGEVEPGEPIAALLERSHALVLPSRHEGRPNVVLEAFASGRPVIGSDIPGTRELLQASGAGHLFPLDNAQALAEAIDQLAEQPETIPTLGHRGREWVVEQGLTWDRTAGKYIDVLAWASGKVLRPRCS
jgi:glycosyltransferase involved in cell wall biosynthesis